MAGHGLFWDRDGFLKQVGVAPVALRLTFFLVLTDLCEAETFAEDHLLRVEDLPVHFVVEESLMDEVVVVVLFEGEDYLLVVDAFGVLDVGQVGKALSRALGVGGLGSAVLAALVAGEVGSVGKRRLREKVGLILRYLALQVDLIGQRVQHFRYIREHKRRRRQVLKLHLQIFLRKFYLLPIIVHDRLINMQFHHFHSLHIVLDIIPNPNQLLNLPMHRLPQPPHLSLNSRAVVEDRVVAHELLDLEDVFDLFEVGGDFLSDEAEVFLGVD